MAPTWGASAPFGGDLAPVWGVLPVKGNKVLWTRVTSLVGLGGHI